MALYEGNFKASLLDLEKSLNQKDIGVIYYLFCAKKYLNYKIKEACCDYMPALLFSLLMGGSVYVFGLLPINKLLLLVMQVLLGGVLYIFLCIVTKNSGMKFILNYIKEKRKK